MITKILIGCSTISIALAVYFLSPLHKPKETIAISVLEDITDAHKATPDVSKIILMYGLKDDEWRGAIFRYSNLTDVSLNATQEKILPEEFEFLSNEFQRAKELNEFTAQITEAVSHKDTSGRSNSSVYLPLAREINTLQNMGATKKIILVYSDLMENESGMSMYEPKTFQKVFSNQESLIAYFNKKLPLADLHGITIYLVYQPKNPTADAQYQVVSSFYKVLLERKGATVLVKANI
jgi:hypothetical protein